MEGENWSEYQKCPLVSCAQLILDLNATEHGQNQLICHLHSKYVIFLVRMGISLKLN